MLDAGCGEGTYTRAIYDALAAKGGCPQLLGADISGLVSALDEDVVSNLPAALSPDSRTQILVGPENVSKELRDTSVVMTKFDIGDGMQGMIGVLGPTRMDYAQITARLSYFAENLSRMFQKNQTPAIEGPENKHNDPEA